MKLIANYFNHILTKPTTLFFLNIFFLKNNLYFNIKYLLYIHTFLNIKSFLKIKILKFNYSMYNNFIFYFIILNILSQIIIIIFFI